MEGKVILEEHFALEETWRDSVPDVLPTEKIDDLRSRLFDFDTVRLREMDANGIEFAILSLNTPTVQRVLDTKEAIALARRSNDFLASEIAKRPDRFAGYAALPMQDPDAATEELSRCIRELGFKGAMVYGFTQKDVADSAIYYDIAPYRPFWAAVEEFGVPFYLHPRLQIPTRARAYEGHQWMMGATWGYASETSLHALRLIGSGLFDAHPKLRVVIGHMGERIPYDLWRIDRWVVELPFDYTAKRPVGDYFRENFFITTSGNFSDAALACAMAELGANRIMFSVDYPYEDTAIGANWFDTTPLDEADRIKIGRTNAIELFKLDLR